MLLGLVPILLENDSRLLQKEHLRKLLMLYNPEL
jgi:hypothetical protein